MPKRLFIALNLPDEVKRQLQRLVSNLHQANKNKPIKWVEEDNFHLTLHFLGEVDEKEIDKINQNLEPIITKYSALKFEITENISGFPDLFNPKVIFLQIKELNDGQAIRLQKEIGEALKKLNFEVDPRPFRLHITLGRVKFKTSVKIPKFPAFTLQTTTGRQFQINSIDLMASTLTPAGPIYEIVNQLPLQ